ncbi:MAG: cyclic nucleotide-binding domain-containing protein [Lachnospiraceae bacterium]|nr:cyclic nucleotide-binding domain-containing protein [Lachnospiraceae bacterium]
MKTIRVSANEVLFRKGDPSDSMFLISSGLIGVYSNYGATGHKLLSVLGKGKYFGEMGVIDNLPRSADVVAVDDSELIEIKAADFSGFVTENTGDVITILKNLSERLRKTNADLEEAENTVKRFLDGNADVNEKSAVGLKAILTAVMNRFSAKKEREPDTSYKAGEILFREGEIGTVMFRVLEGEVSVITGFRTENEKEIAVLGKGASFGELAVIDREYRNATVVAKTDIKVMTVANTQLAHFLSSHPEEAMKILRSVSAKLRATTRSYVDTLAVVSKFVETERKQMANYVGGDEFMTMASHYDYLADQNFNPMSAFYNPYCFL